MVKHCLCYETLHVSAINGQNQTLHTKHENRSVGLLPIVCIISVVSHLYIYHLELQWNSTYPD